MTDRAELERAVNELLTHVEQEAAEVIQACTKLRRFGPDGADPRLPLSPTNIQALCFELGQLWQTVDVVFALAELGACNSALYRGRDRKWQWLIRELEHVVLSLDAAGDLVARLPAVDASPEPGEKEKESGAGNRTEGGGAQIREPGAGEERRDPEPPGQGGEEALAHAHRRLGEGADHDDALWLWRC